MRIDCADCVMRSTDVCRSCIVTHLLDRPAGAVVFDVAEERAIRTLQAAGLAAGTRFRASASGRARGGEPPSGVQAEPA